MRVTPRCRADRRWVVLIMQGFT
ncbi:unnamed protein product [Victoria cruziana]